ncbi:MAG TPA: hypothetical protein VKW08_23780 [Xanthobacteraceae bacterium]|nr:hypothetical protein [Xanthobacteraceae bacterium]
MTTDRVVRLNPKTGEAIEYPLPGETNMRHMFVDNATGRATLLARQQPWRLDHPGRVAGFDQANASKAVP